MPDDFKKVQTGDALHIPAPAYNAFIDTAIAQQRGLTLGGGPQRRLGVSGTVITAYNPTANAIPWHGVVEVLSTEHGEDITVGKSGDAAGAGVYGIALEQIAGSAYGAVALAGGPWKLTVAGSVAPGNQVGPVDGAWTAALAGTPTWEVLRRDTDGIALVRFFRLAQISLSPLLAAATLNISTSTVLSRSFGRLQRDWTGINTSQEIFRAILQFQEPVQLDVVTKDSIILVTLTSSLKCEVGLGLGTDNLFRAEGLGIVIAGITESFDVGSDSFAKLSSLALTSTKQVIIHDFYMIRNPHVGITSWRTWAFAAIAQWPSTLVYGLQVSVPHKAAFVLIGTAYVRSELMYPADWLYIALKA